ncbi:fungal cellulose binding domain-containing protein [Coprinopsis sp. MPI-PUGE-AT-0042]|nr:fungal cellulose binding domain-containing protein [Coprinopsis sp. MPI-PUGE-AT-0042]
MLSLSLFFFLLAAFLQSAVAQSSGCGKSPLASGTRNIGSRQYILQVPANYNSNTRYKLIFGFHWLGGNMNNVAPGYYGLRDLAKETAIFVAPNGLDSGWANTGDRDTQLVDQILNEINNGLCVDQRQIFATGFSYGGGMSYNLACSRPNVFRSVSVIAGAQLSGCTGGETKIPYLGIHGVVDSVLNISQGRGLRDRYLRVNGCQSKNAPEPGRGADSNYMKTEYSCNAGFPVWWIAHGGDHVGSPSSGTNWMAQHTWDFWTRAINEGVATTTTGGTTPAPTTPVPTTPVPTTTPQPTTAPGNCSAKWGQCGGQGWSGPACCQSGSTCSKINDWYHQCI